MIHILIDRPLVYQAVKFGSVLLTAHLLLSILQWIQRRWWNGLDSFRRIIITSVVVLFPSFAGQISLSFVPHYVALLLFVWGFYLLLLHLDASTFRSRIRDVVRLEVMPSEPGAPAVAAAAFYGSERNVYRSF